MDGTLTVPVHDFDAIRRELGLEAGQPILEQLACLPGAQAEPLMAKLARIEQGIARDSTPAVGALQLISALSGRGHRLGILTRNTRANALLTLEAIGLSGYFEVADVLGREEAPPKPSPAGILSLLRRWGVPSSAAGMVGDYRFDLEAGRRAGTWTVHVEAEARFSWPDLTDLGVRSLDELLKVSCGSEATPDITP